MLVLSRRKVESLVIDGRIVVTVLGVRGRSVRLGIEAPKEVSVRRSELPACAPPRAAAAHGAKG